MDDEDIDYYFLESDEATLARWKKKHNLFETEKGTSLYQLCLNTLNGKADEGLSRQPIHQGVIIRGIHHIALSL